MVRPGRYHPATSVRPLCRALQRFADRNWPHRADDSVTASAFHRVGAVGGRDVRSDTRGGAGSGGGQGLELGDNPILPPVAVRAQMSFDRPDQVSLSSVMPTRRDGRNDALNIPSSG